MELQPRLETFGRMCYGLAMAAFGKSATWNDKLIDRPILYYFYCVCAATVTTFQFPFSWMVLMKENILTFAYRLGYYIHVVLACVL